jgi:hypothetical protein
LFGYVEPEKKLVIEQSCSQLGVLVTFQTHNYVQRTKDSLTEVKIEDDDHKNEYVSVSRPVCTCFIQQEKSKTKPQNFEMVGSFRVTLGHPKEVGVNEILFAVFPDYKVETSRKKGSKAIGDLKANNRIVVNRTNFRKGTASFTLDLKNLNILLDYIQTGVNDKTGQEAERHIMDFGKNKVQEFKDSQEYNALVNVLL